VPTTAQQPLNKLVKNNIIPTPEFRAFARRTGRICLCRPFFDMLSQSEDARLICRAIEYFYLFSVHILTFSRIFLKLIQYFFDQFRSDLDSILSIGTINLTYVTNQHEPRPFFNCLFVVLYQVYQVSFG